MTFSLSLLMATESRAKLGEIRGLIAGLPVEVLSPREALGEAAPPAFAEGATFEEAALAKARAFAEATMMITLAEAAGLEVEALGGRPGVRSARFAGEGATDAENNAELLRRLDDVDGEGRRARFRVAFALIDPWWPHQPTVVSGSCGGHIARKPSGTGGFGYDPLFIIDGAGSGRTLAELDDAERRAVGHRAHALRELRPHLVSLVERRLDDAVAIPAGTFEPPPSRRG
jgi:XTP/dITP diphosphohydrolase